MKTTKDLAKQLKTEHKSYNRDGTLFFTFLNGFMGVITLSFLLIASRQSFSTTASVTLSLTGAIAMFALLSVLKAKMNKHHERNWIADGLADYKLRNE